MSIKCTYIPGFINVSVTAPTRGEVVKLFNQFERNAKTLNIETAKTEAVDIDMEMEEESETTSPVIFIGHGRNAQWKDLRDHLRDQQHYEVCTYEGEPRAGYSISDILKKMLDE